MPLMLVEADVLHRVLKALEDNVHIDSLRQRQRTPVLGLRAMVNEARAQERVYEERVRTADVVGCLECSVLNDVSHCRECKAPLEVEPIRCTEDDLQPAVERLTREREERRAREEQERLEMRARARARTAADWLAEFRRLTPRSRLAGRGVPTLCQTALSALHECQPCYDVAWRFVRREQGYLDGIVPLREDLALPADPHAEECGSAEVRSAAFDRLLRLAGMVPEPIPFTITEALGEDAADDE